MNKQLLFILIILLLGVLVYLFFPPFSQTPVDKTANFLNINNINQVVLPSDNVASKQKPLAIAEPISGALVRVTKKPFGVRISPTNSPVSPERFKGYHTGVDFETTSEEQNIDVTIYAVCDGKLLVKRFASGYGGVAVQSCQIDGQAVTVIYGHLRLSSISVKVNQELKSGQQFAVLGTGFSTETDGERKHLHFGIHKGTAISILGYVQSENALSDWIDPVTLLK